MPVQILIMAAETPPNPAYKKGMVVAALEEPVQWGSKECLPMFCKVKIEDGTKTEADIYSQPWTTDLQFDVVGDQITVSISPKIVEFTDHRLNLEAFLTYKGFDEVLSNDFTCVFNCTENVESVIAEIKDACETQVSPSPYVIPAKNVDNIVNAGGYMEVTKEYAESIVVDRRL